MKSFIYLFTYLFISLQCASKIGAQTTNHVYEVTFKKQSPSTSGKYVSLNEIIPNKISDYSFLKGIPSKYKPFAIYSINMQTAVEKDEKYIKKIYLYVGLDKKNGKKYVIVDCNNDLNFANDKLYTYSLADYKNDIFYNIAHLLPPIQVNSFYFNGKKEVPVKVDLAINAFDSDKDKKRYASEDEYYLSVIVLLNSYMKGQLYLNKKRFCVTEGYSNAFNVFTPPYLNKFGGYRFFQETDSILPYTYKIGDTISVGGQKLYLEKINKRKLYLKDLGSLADSSTVGSVLPALYSKGVVDNKRLHLNDLMRNKYVFIDFWGSWCAPCVGSLPETKELYEEVKNRDDVLILGIALETENSIDQLKNIIKSKDVNWLNVWNTRADGSLQRSSSNLFGKLRIMSFPTYIIVDKTGKISYRTMSSLKAKEAIDYFKKLIKQK